MKTLCLCISFFCAGFLISYYTKPYLTAEAAQGFRATVDATKDANGQWACPNATVAIEPYLKEGEQIGMLYVDQHGSLVGGSSGFIPVNTDKVGNPPPICIWR